MTASLVPASNSRPAHIWNGRQLADAFTFAATWLDANREPVNALNVFPVPDGDTGTNMAMTMLAAVKAIADEDLPVSDVGRQLAYGALMGARGNSGVILSQIFRGFASGLQDRDEMDGRDLARALGDAQEMAYKAVMRPVEGTMLTVIRGAADRAIASAARTPSLLTVLGEAIAGANQALESTPDLLAILKQAGVVDAGGQGIVLILEGLERYARGDTVISSETLPARTPGADMAFLDQVGELHGESEFGYCTNFMLFGRDLDFAQFREDVAAMGQSAVIVGDESMIKVHIHTQNPGQVLDHAIQLGALDQIKIDNMSSQTAVLSAQRAIALLAEPPPDAEFQGSIAVVAVASGNGLAEALRTMGATTVVRGGQSMNPSTEDLLRAVEQAPVDDVMILPNNRNIILAANQVAGLTGKSIRVVPTISVPQALAALAVFNPGQSLDANLEAMTGAATAVITLELTRAVRNVELNGVQIASGQMIGLIDDELEAAGDDIAGVAATLFAKANADDAELVTVFAGEDATDAEIAAIGETVGAAFPEAESDFQTGGQPHYLFIISIE